MTLPPFLSPGDRVAFAAPARKIMPSKLQPAISLLQSWGLQPVVPDHLYDSYHQFAGPDSIRTALMQQLLDDPEIKAIFCVRGGYGTVRIIDNLDFSHFAQHPKWIVGYSDITVLHSHIQKNLGIATLHATMPIDIEANHLLSPTPALQSLHSALFGKSLCHTLPSHPFNRPGSCRAPLTGGNLSILYSLSGSASDISTEGKILFIEDLDEYLYHIDRMMQNLKRSGHLADLAALIVGQLNKMHDNTIPFGRSAEEIVLDAVSPYNYPVCFNFPSGHIGPDNRALILGQEAHLIVGDEVQLHFLPK